MKDLSKKKPIQILELFGGIGDLEQHYEIWEYLLNQ